MDPVLLGLAVGSKLLGGLFGLKSGKEKRKAARTRRRIGEIQNFQAYRNYMNKFLSSQGAALAQAGMSGAGLGSSGVQGTLASMGTQARVGTAEFQRLGELGAYAGRREDKAGTFAGYSSLAAGVGDAFAVGAEWPE